jgi:hypothetical protein
MFNTADVIKSQVTMKKLSENIVDMEKIVDDAIDLDIEREPKYTVAPIIWDNLSESAKNKVTELWKQKTFFEKNDTDQ